MRINLNLSIDRRELKAGAQYQDKVAQLIAVVSGHDVISADINAWTAMKVALGSNHTDTQTSQFGTITTTINRRGIAVNLNLDVPPEVAITVFKLYGDVLEAWVPVIVAGKEAMTTTVALAETATNKLQAI